MSDPQNVVEMFGRSLGRGLMEGLLGGDGLHSEQIGTGESGIRTRLILRGLDGTGEQLGQFSVAGPKWKESSPPKLFRGMEHWLWTESEEMAPWPDGDFCVEQSYGTTAPVKENYGSVGQYDFTRFTYRAYTVSHTLVANERAWKVSREDMAGTVSLVGYLVVKINPQYNVAQTMHWYVGSLDGLQLIEFTGSHARLQFEYIAAGTGDTPVASAQYHLASVSLRAASPWDGIP